jgi:menaquinone-dependent protoporphyrinogen oxidase
VRILVSAASKHGATTQIAQEIGGVLAARGWDVTVCSPDKVETAAQFDAAILGSAVYMGQWMKPARDLIKRIAGDLGTKSVWLFSSGPVGDPLKPADNPVDVSKLMTLTKARGHQLFGGKLTKKDLSMGERAMAAALRVQDGDNRNWSEIRRWAAEVADALASETP